MGSRETSKSVPRNGVRAHLAVIIDSAVDAILIADASDRIVHVNPAAERTFGCRAAQAVGRPVANFMPARFRAAHAGHRGRTAQGGALIEGAGLRADGSEFPMEGTMWEFAADGHRMSAAILRDITARKHAERLNLAQHKRLRRLASMLATARDDEQRRIGEGLHDDVAQVIAAGSVKLALLRRETRAAARDRLCEQIDQLLREADRKIHSLSFELGTTALHHGGLERALRDLCDRMRARYGVRFVLKRRGAARPLAGGMSTVLLKAARELLFNVVKHAAVREAAVALVWSRDEARITVVDHGKGFRGRDHSRLASASQGLGLFAVRERLLDLGGELRIRSARGKGARVTVRVPLRRGRGLR